MTILEPKSPGFRSIKNLMNRFESKEKDSKVSVEDKDVPAWQRQTVWTEDEMGLLAYSIIRQYPIGMIILWKKSSGVRVPIDGRQRLTAIRHFYTGEVAIPELPAIDEKHRKAKYRLLPGDEKRGFKELSSSDRDAFEDYELNCVEFEGLDESIAMDIFVNLQGGKSLTKTEVRAALGGRLCDFVTELTASDEENDSRHAFFKLLTKNLKNRRKSHRNIADILLHEYFFPGEDKHWSSLEALYREKAKSLSNTDKQHFLQRLDAFLRATTIGPPGAKILMPQLKSAHLILSVFRAWNSLVDDFDVPKDEFAKAIKKFESNRIRSPDAQNNLRFTSALSNAGYAKNRISIRHEILMDYLAKTIPRLRPKARDRKRVFSMDQKIEIWERANHQCEFEEDGVRCSKKFAHPKEGDADHIVLWSQNGPTTLSNGRLLCARHNRGRKSGSKAATSKRSARNSAT